MFTSLIPFAAPGIDDALLHFSLSVEKDLRMKDMLEKRLDWRVLQLDSSDEATVSPDPIGSAKELVRRTTLLLSCDIFLFEILLPSEQTL